MELGTIILIDPEGKVTEGSVVIEDGATTWVRVGNHYTKGGDVRSD